MRKILFFITVMLASLSLLTACGAGQPPTEAQHQHTEIPVEPAEVLYKPGDWLGMPLTDSRTGTSFKLADYSGQTVILEMMDPGCSICRDQVTEVKAALEVLGDKATAVSVDIGYKDVEVQIKWADMYGATWTLTQTTKDFGQALIAEFGGHIVHASSAPIIIIDPAGEWHFTDPGIKKSETLVDLVNQWAQ